MHAVLIVIHLFVALGLVGLILLQRSEGGALGMGGGPGGLMSGRAAGNVLTKATTALGAVFFITSIALTIWTELTAGGGGVLDAIDPNALVAPAPANPAADAGVQDALDQLLQPLLTAPPAEGLGAAGDAAPAGEAPASDDTP